MPDLDPHLEAKIRQLVPSLQGWCAVEKALEMAQALCEIRPRICVEIGVFGGRSLLPQALACQSLQQGHVFGIDPWSATDSLEALSHPDDIAYWSQLDHEAIFRGCLQALLNEGLTPFCSLIRASAQHCADLFVNIDVLHIDGNHSRESRFATFDYFCRSSEPEVMFGLTMPIGNRLRRPSACSAKNAR